MRRVAGSLEHQRLVEPDAQMAVGEGSHRVGIEGRGVGAGGVEDDEIVSEPLHLRELDAHGGRA
jgi:hypothetical protein